MCLMLTKKFNKIGWNLGLLPIQVDFHLFQICVEKYIFFASNRLLRFETKTSGKQNSESYLEM